MSAAAAVKAALQAASSLNSKAGKEDGESSGLLLKLILAAMLGITLIVAALSAVITSPYQWADDKLEEFQQKYSFVIGDGSGLSGTVYTDSEISQMVDGLDISDARKDILRQALSLAGRVSYFWGGKSTAEGWDERWGQYMEVTSGGSSTTGTTRPFGLDCTGYVDWVMLNAGVDTYPSLYGYAWGEHITKNDLIPGDLAFVSDNSANGICHVGIYFGTDANGKRLFLHCSCSKGVVLNSYSGFNLFARLYIKEE